MLFCLKLSIRIKFYLHSSKGRANWPAKLFEVPLNQNNCGHSKMYFMDFLKTDFFSHSNRNFENGKPEELDYKNTYKIFNVPFWLERVMLNCDSLILP